MSINKPLTKSVIIYTVQTMLVFSHLLLFTVENHDVYMSTDIAMV